MVCQIASWNVEVLNSIENGTLTQLGSAPIYRFISDGSSCSTTADFDFNITDTEGNLSTNETITINIGTTPTIDVSSQAKVGSSWADFDGDPTDPAAITAGNVTKAGTNQYRWKQTQDSITVAFELNYEATAATLAAGDTITVALPAGASYSTGVKGFGVAHMYGDPTTGNEYNLPANVTCVGSDLIVTVPETATTLDAAGDAGRIVLSATFELY